MTDIRDVLGDEYGGDTSRRRLLSAELGDTLLFALDGTPPKGYAIYVPDLSEISSYDHQGQRFRHESDVQVIR